MKPEPFSPSADITRRAFLSESARLAAGTVVSSQFACLLPGAVTGPEPVFQSDWQRRPDRIWIGSEYWSNPLQDWRVKDGRVECVSAAPNRNLQVLVCDVRPGGADLRLSVRMGRIGGGPIGFGSGSAGFRLGIRSAVPDPRARILSSTGLNAGISADGGLTIGGVRTPAPSGALADLDVAELRLLAEPARGDYRVTLAVHDSRGVERARMSTDIAAEELVGGLALVTNFGRAEASKPSTAPKVGAPDERGARGGKFWFSDWTVAGSKAALHPERSFGPILFSQYTSSFGILKLTAQMPPIGSDDEQQVRLDVQRGGEWQRIASEPIAPDTCIAAFRVESWDATVDVPYRLVYLAKAKDGTRSEHRWEGLVRRDPVDQPVLTVADVSCNTHHAFPNEVTVANLTKLDPDLIAFTGDQFYEGSAGFGTVRAPLETAILDYLRKWYLHGWTWREVMRDRPSLALPDDHDVFQGNLWGEGGAEVRRRTHAAGGYWMAVEWVNVVHRTQTSHHPDPFDPSPGKRGTINFYGPLTYGRVSFAVLADRQYKSGPEDNVPPTDGRGDHVTDRSFDPKVADLPGLELLGAKQEQFLREWAADWRGADLKAVISQTIFTALATTHGHDRQVLRADYDASGWPQTPRNRAVREMRKAFAIHLAGDQHLPALVQYGIDEHRDGPVAFAGPAVNVGYPRWWEPEIAPWTRSGAAKGVTGDFVDGFGHPVTVLAVKNPPEKPSERDPVRLMHEKASGLGVVRFDKPNRKITVECWPLLADVARPGSQFPGWPVTLHALDNYGRRTVAHLPTLRFRPDTRPVVQVFEQTTGELVYAWRPNESRFQPHVFDRGEYRVRVGHPETDTFVELDRLVAVPGNAKTIDVGV